MKVINTFRIALTVYIISIIGGILLLASLAGCSTMEAVDAYAKEHNFYGESVCDAHLPEVSEVDSSARGCPTSAIDYALKGDIHGETEGSKEAENAL